MAYFVIVTLILSFSPTGLSWVCLFGYSHLFSVVSLSLILCRRGVGWGSELTVVKKGTKGTICSQWSTYNYRHALFRNDYAFECMPPQSDLLVTRIIQTNLLYMIEDVVFVWTDELIVPSSSLLTILFFYALQAASGTYRYLSSRINR